MLIESRLERVIAITLLCGTPILACSSGDDDRPGVTPTGGLGGGDGDGDGDGDGGLGGVGASSGGNGTSGSGGNGTSGSGGVGTGGTPIVPKEGLCKDKVCEAGQECYVDQENEVALCRCKQGFFGPNCADINECLTGAPCAPEASCENFPGGFFCECQAGYRGTGQSCENIDECAEGISSCDAQASCSDQPGDHTCSCEGAVVGSGFYCVDSQSDACAPNPCQNGSCQNTPAGFVCQCDPGFGGTTCDESCGDLTFSDPVLEQVVRSLLGVEAPAPITQQLAGYVSDLRLERLGITDLSGLECWPELRSLDVSDNAIGDLSPISHLTQLELLDLSCNPIDDLEALSGLADLSSLSLRGSGCDAPPNLQNTDLDALADLFELSELSLGFLGLSDVSALQDLKELSALRLEGNQLTSVASLGELHRLRTLGLSSNALADLDGLSGLGQLLTLEASRNQIQDLSGLSGVSSLKRLRLDENQITDLSPLSALQELTLLDLRGNAIEDVAPLAALDVDRLELSRNQIEDLSPWVEDSSFLPRWEVVLSQNPLDCEEQADALSALSLRGITLYADCN